MYIKYENNLEHSPLILEMVSGLIKSIVGNGKLFRFLYILSPENPLFLYQKKNHKDKILCTLNLD